ncbi:putative mediator complex subunit 14 [Tieghemostelium lacteum]|uniref:Mediator of RNA polymerase II transcription subunit 14 n=1 Tax=Tieghemostelium lacteum TaxID=361077 RepID=A0A151ZEL3_TIELA|nr:putative mediator complex subunit 14 [Tieghemostelium lacteum]|eukprot:KYQ92350.1 putative mediator complex subunit 14 [Tieghemostelium lacteum]
MNNQGQSPPPDPNNNNVSLSLVIHRLVENSYNNLLSLTEKLPNHNDQDRKKAIIDYLDSTREKFLRLLVLMKWSDHVSTLTKANQIMHLLNQEDSYFRDTADELIMTKFNLINARAPIYDIPTAIDVLTTGSYQRMPTDIKKVIPPPPLTSIEIDSAMEKLNDIIKYKLFITDIPKEFEPIRVENGIAHIVVPNEYSATLSIDGGTEKSNWVLTSLNLYIYSQKDQNGEGPIKVAYENKMKYVQDRIQNRISSSSSPLFELHNIVHHLCITSQLDILISQIDGLKKTMIKNNIKCVQGKDQSLTVFYWIPEEMNIASAGPTSLGNLNIMKNTNFRISIDETLKLKVTHYPNIHHPKNENYFNLNVNLNLETLLLKTIELNSYHKVLALFNILLSKSNSNPPTSSSTSTGPSISNPSSILLSTQFNAINNRSFHLNDIKLVHSSKFSSDANMNGDISVQEGTLPTVLRIKLYGSKYLDVSVNFQNGRYNLLKSSSSSSSSSYFQSIQEISQQQELKLNSDPNEIRSIVNIFKHRSLLSCFEEASLFLGIESFYKLPITFSNIPTISEILQADSNYIYTRLPQEVDNYYLIINIQPQTFIPTFYLITCRTNTKSSILYAESIIRLENESLQSLLKSCDCNNSQFQFRIQNLLSQIISVAKEKIHFLNITQHLQKQSIPFEIYQSDKIQFVYTPTVPHLTNPSQPPQPINPKHYLLNTDKMLIRILNDIPHSHISNNGCSTKVGSFNYYYEISFQCPRLLNYDNSLMKLDSERLNFHYQDGQWKFRYSSSSSSQDWLTRFNNDLISINCMANITSLILKEIKSQPDQYPPSVIQVVSIQPMEIQLLLFPQKETRNLLHIYIKDPQKKKEVSLLFQPSPNPLVPFLEKELNNDQQPSYHQNISHFLKSIINSNDISFAIHNLLVPPQHRLLQLQSNGATQPPSTSIGSTISNHQTQQPTSLVFNPLDLLVVPRSTQQIRLIYKNHFGIDIKILSQEYCDIEDSYYSTLNNPTNTTTTGGTTQQPGNTTPTNTQTPATGGASAAAAAQKAKEGIKLNMINSFYQLMEQKLNLPALDNPLNNRTSWMVPIANISKILTKIFIYISSLYVFRQATIFICNIFGTHYKIIQNISIIKWENKYFFFNLIIKEPSIELEMMNKEQNGIKALVPVEDLKLLTEFFHRKVNQQSYKSQTIGSLIQMLTLPPLLFVELCKVIASCKTKPPQCRYARDLTTNTSIWNTANKETFHHSEKTTTIYFIVRFINVQNNNFIDIPLKYNYSQRLMNYWNKLEPFPNQLQQSSASAITLTQDPIESQKIQIIDQTATTASSNFQPSITNIDQPQQSLSDINSYILYFIDNLDQNINSLLPFEK